MAGQRPCITTSSSTHRCSAPLVTRRCISSIGGTRPDSARTAARSRPRRPRGVSPVIAERSRSGRRRRTTCSTRRCRRGWRKTCRTSAWSRSCAIRSRAPGPTIATRSNSASRTCRSRTRSTPRRHGPPALPSCTRDCSGGDLVRPPAPVLRGAGPATPSSSSGGGASSRENSCSLCAARTCTATPPDFDAICAHLGIDTWQPPAWRAYNATKPAGMRADTEARLRELFAPWNAAAGRRHRTGLGMGRPLGVRTERTPDRDLDWLLDVLWIAGGPRSRSAAAGRDAVRRGARQRGARATCPRTAPRLRRRCWPPPARGRRPRSGAARSSPSSRVRGSSDAGSTSTPTIRSATRSPRW